MTPKKPARQSPADEFVKARRGIMTKGIVQRGALAAFSALAAFAAASLLAPSNAAAQAVTGLNAEILLLRPPQASLSLLDEPIPAGAGGDSYENFNLPTLPPNLSKLHDFDSFRLTLPFHCSDCLNDVQNAIKNDGTLFLALAPQGYCATQFPTEGSPVVLHVPAAELHERQVWPNTTVYTWSGRPEILALFDGTGSPATPLARRRTAARPQPRFVNLTLTITGGGGLGLLGRFGIPAETGELDADGDADLSSLFPVFPSDPSQVSTDVVLAVATGVAKPDDVSVPSDPTLPLGLIASCETLPAPITVEAPPGL
jgi:hypothetical protein